MSEDFEKICRLCIQSSLGLYDIFNQNISYDQIIEGLVCIKVENSYEFPRKICRDCQSQILSFHNFKLRCLKNDELLHEQYLARKNIKGEFVSPSTGIEMENTTFNIKIEEIEMQDDERNCFFFENNEEIVYSTEKAEIYTANGKTLQEIENKVDNNCIATTKLNENKVIHKKKPCQKAKENPLEEIGYEFKNNTTAVIKKRKQTKNYKTSVCHLCGKFYDNSTPARAEYHTNLHTGARPYICELSECGKAFPAKFLLQRHFRLYHTSRRPYECDICGRKYRLKDEVTRHRTVHFEPQLPCPVCGKLFKNKNGIRQHMVTHGKNKRHECAICSKCFQYPATLKAHQLVHTKEKKIECKQ